MAFREIGEGARAVAVGPEDTLGEEGVVIEDGDTGVSVARL